MSQEYAWPATWRREGESPPPVAGETEAARDDLAPALVLSGLPQAFDLFACAIVAVTVFPQAYFPTLGAPGALAAGVAVWALAYPAALLSRRAFAATGRGRNPGPRIAAARVLFAGATVAIGLLPAAREAALAPLFLVLARAIQGLAMGGLGHDAAGADPARPGPAARRARLRVRALAGGIGLAAAGGLLGVLALGLKRPDFLAWGWRYPSVIALAVNVAAFAGDLHAETARRAKDRPQLRLVTFCGAPVDPRA